MGSDDGNVALTTLGRSMVGSDPSISTVAGIGAAPRVGIAGGVPAKAADFLSSGGVVTEELVLTHRDTRNPPCRPAVCLGLGVALVHPVLFRIPGVDWPLHTYGVLIVTGFLAAMYVAHREAKRQGRYAEEVLDFAFWALLGGMIGARIVFILVNWHEYFVDHPIDHVGGIPIPAVFVVWKGGLVFYGAALGGFVAFLWYTKKHNILGVDKLFLADLMVVGVPLAHAFGRLGCVAAGCCWGDSAYHIDAAGQIVADIPFAAYFPEGSLAYTSLISSVDPDVATRMHELKTTMPLIPVQLI